MKNSQKHLEKAIQIDPDFADAHYELALILKDKSEKEKSRQHLMKAIEINPEFAQAHFHLALLLISMTDPKAARKHFTKAININQDFKRIVEEKNYNINDYSLQILDSRINMNIEDIEIINFKDYT